MAKLAHSTPACVPHTSVIPRRDTSIKLAALATRTPAGPVDKGLAAPALSPDWREALQSYGRWKHIESVVAAADQQGLRAEELVSIQLINGTGPHRRVRMPALHFQREGGSLVTIYSE